MTSLSTILALIPILLSSGIASDLQKPLATVVIVGLTVGTWSSIYLLPSIYSKFR
ncbi:MAG: efflux RND transporter permease subunit [Bacteroidota bacterium]